jgi:thioredoxin 1
MGNEYVFTEGNFTEATAGGVSLVDFWAPWCGPCRTQGPIVEKLASAYNGRARIGKMNVDENRQIAQSLGIRAIPTLILFKDGREVRRFTGIQSEEQLADAMDDTLA